MARGIYTRCLGAVSFTAPATATLFTVPTGRVYVLEELDVIGVAAVGSYMALTWGPGGFGFVQFDKLTGNASMQWRGRQAFVAGQNVGLAATAGTWYIRATGFDLTA